MRHFFCEEKYFSTRCEPFSIKKNIFLLSVKKNCEERNLKCKKVTVVKKTKGNLRKVWLLCLCWLLSMIFQHHEDPKCDSKWGTPEITDFILIRVMSDMFSVPNCQILKYQPNCLVCLLWLALIVTFSNQVRSLSSTTKLTGSITKKIVRVRYGAIS